MSQDKHIKVLVLDNYLDEEPLTRNFHKALLDNVFFPFVALNESWTLEVAIEDSPHLILMNLLRPEFDGFEISCKLKLDPRTKNIPVIFLTEYKDNSHADNGIEIGAKECISNYDGYLNIQDYSKEILKNIIIEELQISNETRIMIESSKSIVVMDRKTKIVIDANPSACALCGVSSIKELQLCKKIGEFSRDLSILER